MARDPLEHEGAPDLQDVLDALDDAACRTIIERLEEPMTAKEVANACDAPLSTTYRKLDRLSDASLVEERTEVRRDGHHTTRYRRAFEAVMITVDSDDGFDIAIPESTESADERLAALWSEVREET